MIDLIPKAGPHPFQDLPQQKSAVSQTIGQGAKLVIFLYIGFFIKINAAKHSGISSYQPMTLWRQDWSAQRSWPAVHLPG
jgi:hypothetical protein